MLYHPSSVIDFINIADKLEVGIAIVDENGIFVYINDFYEVITNSTKQDWLGVAYNVPLESGRVDILGSETLREVVFREKKTAHRIINYGNEHDVVVTATPIFDHNREIIMVIYILTDWDELTNLKQQLFRSFEREDASKQYIKNQLMEELDNYQIIAHDTKMRNIYSMAQRIAQVNATVLILGESGVGKDVMAKYIHYSGPRKDNNFIHVNCGAIPESLFESELFGYTGGAFTGALRQGKMGLIELADKGTLFLDEVGELPLSVQAKLLTVLQEKEITRVGGTKSIPVDVRIIAATNKDLFQLVKERKFREDLYYRLNILELTIPPLRERKCEIPNFINEFTELFNKQYNQNKIVSKDVINMLIENDWAGNVRELRHLMERLIIICPEKIITREYLPREFQQNEMFYEAIKLADQGKTLKMIVEEVEKEVICDTINKTNNLKEAAKKLDIELSTLTKKKQKYNIYCKKDIIQNQLI